MKQKSLDLFSAIIISTMLAILVISVIHCYKTYNNNDVKSSRDYAYEHYCDSIYESNPDYYLDVLAETDKYQQYLKEHREWWNK